MLATIPISTTTIPAISIPPRKDMMTEAGYGQVQIIKDLAGLDRVVAGKAGTKKGKQEKDV